MTQPSRSTFLAKILAPLEQLSERLPALYVGITAVVGLAGFLALLFFPLLLLFSIGSSIDALSGDFAQPASWTSLLLWISVTLLSGLVCHQLIKTRMPLPAGVELTREVSPRLFELLDELKQDYKWVSLHRVIVIDGFAMDIVSTPRYVLPVWNTHSLTIGMGQLQCLSPAHFKCMLARKLGQFSKQQNFLTNILYQLRHDWDACRETYKANTAFGLFPLALFFRCHAPLYRLLSTYLARLEELKADVAAQRVINGEDVLDAIEKSLMARRYLDNHYWPAIRAIINKDPQARPMPYDKLLMAFKNNERKPGAINLLKLEYALQPAFDDPLPSLGARMDNLGYTALVPPSLNGTAASLDLLGKHYWPITRAIDKLWQKQTGRHWRQSALQTQHDRSDFNALYRKAKRQKLSYREMWRYRTLVQNLSGKKTALSWQHLLLRRLPEFTAAK